jgi:hypothetical protein
MLMLALTLTGSIAAPGPNEFNLVGLWETASTTRGGIGHAIEFRPDGTYVESTVVIVDTPYRLVGNRLHTGSDTETGKSPTAAFEGGVLVQTAPDGSVVRKERIPGPPPSPLTIVGAWRYCHYAGVPAYERYSENASMQFRLPMTSSTGRYSLQGDQLTLTADQRPGVKAKVEARGDNLVISRTGGGPAEYRREPTGAWYPIGKIEKCGASPLEVPLPPRSPPPIEQFIGMWRNVEPKTGNWTRVEIRANNENLRVQIWGKCHPSDCDLGTVTAKYKGSPIVLFSNLDFVKTRFTLWLEDDVLHMTTADHFTDDSGRPDAVFESRFRK